MIQVRIAPVVVKTLCDVRTVALSWDDLPVHATFLCGMSRRSQVCGMSFVSGIKFLRDVSSVSCLGDDQLCHIGVRCLPCPA